MDPRPGPWTLLGGEPLRLFGARVVSGAGQPGRVIAADGGRVVVACSEGAVAFGEVQPAGRKRMPAGAFLRGHPFAPGTVLGA